jgi:hypothetical protein
VLFIVLHNFLIVNADDFARWLLEVMILTEETVMVAPAAGFILRLGRNESS